LNFDTFEEDIEPPWLRKQREDAKEAEKNLSVEKKISYKSGDQVGNFLFVKYNKYKNRATFKCQECGRKFTYNIYSIKNKKKCKWHKFHDKTIKKL